MWALRRAACSSRSGISKSLQARACAKLEILHDYKEYAAGHHGEYCWGIDICHLPKSPLSGPCMSSGSVLWSRSLSSQAGAKSGDEDGDLEDGFSDLDLPPETDNIIGVDDKGDDEELMPDGGQYEDLSDTRPDLKAEKPSRKKSNRPSLFMVIMNTSKAAMNAAIEKWVEKGNTLDRSEVTVALMNLRMRHLYSKALQFMEWLEETKRLDFIERDYSSRLDLVAKVHGLHRAERYIQRIPKSLRTEVVYRTLLANHVASGNITKSEEVFNTMRDLGFSVSTFAYNQLLLLYKRVDKKKVADILLLMEKENARPSLFTYKLLIDIKGSAKDIAGMERIVDTMKAEGLEPDFLIQAMVVKNYIFAALHEKAEVALREIEGDDIKQNRACCKALLPLYAALGKADDVGRIWKVCVANPRMDECLAVIEAWDKLGVIENAEKIFEDNLRKWKELMSSRFYCALLKVYENHKLLSKAKELADRMLDGGCRMDPMVVDALVKLYIEAGEVEKAESMLPKTAQQNRRKLLYSTYMALLESYANRGDVHNAEKVFDRLRHAGYTGRIKQYQSLLWAYVNAKAPAYGFRERMKADNIFPNKDVAAQLAAVDAFRKSQISELLD